MSICIGCKTELEKDVIGMFELIRYCNNPECPRYGLITVISGEKETS